MGADRQQPAQQRPLAWYVRRLQSMPLAEIPHRVKEACLKQLGRLPLVARRDARLPSGFTTKKLPVLPLKTVELKMSISADELKKLGSDVDRLCNQPLELLGKQWPLDSSCDWSLDPESLQRWSWQQYTFSIPRRSGQGPGDVKLVWELSRLQHLQVLALGAFVLDRDDAKTRCLQHLDAWLEGNPPHQGLAYASGIELASRVVSILFIVTCLGSDSIPAPLATKIWQALAVHGKWIARFPSLYSSANNHLVAESVALFVLGCVAPELPGAIAWRSKGWARIAELAGLLVLADGAGAEQSPTYLAYTMEWFLLARVVKSTAHKIDKTEIDAALRRGACFISCISDIRGHMPFIGDCDDSVVLKAGLEEDNHPGSIVIAIAAVLRSGDILHPAFAADLRTRLFTAAEVPQATLQLQSNVFELGGYTVLRSREASREVFLMFDHGPLGYEPMAGHGHADALSVWLHVDGKPVLVDFGTYRYNADAGWRDWARSTAAHNTIEINGLSQSDITGPFNWGRKAAGILIEHNTADRAQFCRAAHDGYIETCGIRHKRLVETDSAAGLVVTDELAGEGRHSVKLHFHLSPEVEVESLVDEEFALYLVGNPIINMKIYGPCMDVRVVRQSGNMQPGAGVTSPSYNQLSPASSIVVSGQVELPYACRTVFSFVDQKQI